VLDEADRLLDLGFKAELDRIVADSASRGELTQAQATLLSRALEFDTRPASAVMVPWNKVQRLRASAGCDELVDALAGGHTRFPVYERGSEVIGVVHAKDLLAVDDDPAELQVRSLVRDIVAVPETATARVVLAEMRRHASELALVVDEWGGPAGVVTLEDLLEELVGEIDDEFDPTGHAHARRGPDGSWTVPGLWRLDEVARECALELPRGAGYTTVAGLVMQRLQRIPSCGDRVELDGVTLVVVTMERHSVTEVTITMEPVAAAAAGRAPSDVRSPTTGEVAP